MKEVLRQEKKYQINKIESSKLIAIMKRIMMEDKHNKDTGYMVRTLYFDTPYDKDYQEKDMGVFNRHKIRLRTYSSDSEIAKFEIKQKQGSYQRKRSLAISREDAQAVVSGKYHVLLEYKESLATELFYILNTYCYRPRIIVEYNRTAFVANENDVRITIDSDLKATESCYNLFSENLLLYPVAEKFNDILEVKFNGFLPGYIKDITSISNKMELSISKYCMARVILR